MVFYHLFMVIYKQYDLNVKHWVLSIPHTDSIQIISIPSSFFDVDGPHGTHFFLTMLSGTAQNSSVPEHSARNWQAMGWGVVVRCDQMLWNVVNCGKSM